MNNDVNNSNRVNRTALITTHKIPDAQDKDDELVDIHYDLLGGQRERILSSTSRLQ